MYVTLHRERGPGVTPWQGSHTLIAALKWKGLFKLKHMANKVHRLVNKAPYAIYTRRYTRIYKTELTELQ